MIQITIIITMMMILIILTIILLIIIIIIIIVIRSADSAPRAQTIFFEQSHQAWELY